MRITGSVVAPTSVFSLALLTTVAESIGHWAEAFSDFVADAGCWARANRPKLKDETTKLAMSKAIAVLLMKVISIENLRMGGRPGGQIHLTTDLLTRAIKKFDDNSQNLFC